MKELNLETLFMRSQKDAYRMDIIKDFTDKLDIECVVYPSLDAILVLVSRDGRPLGKYYFDYGKDTKLSDLLLHLKEEYL